MVSAATAIQPLLPPRLDQDAGSYSRYLEAYDLYANKVKEIRAGARDSAAAAKAARPIPQPAKRAPALTATQRRELGDAFAKGIKFGELTFPLEDQVAARKRWQALVERGRARSKRGLTGPERRELDNLRNEKVAGQNLDMWREVRVELRPLLRQAGVEPRPRATIAEDGKTVLSSSRGAGKIRPNTMTSYTASDAAMVVAAVKKLVTPPPAPAPAPPVDSLKLAKIAKLDAEAELARSESSLKAAQAETQRRRAQLKKTVVERVSGTVIDKDIVMLPDTTTTVESLLEGSAAAVATQPRDKLPITIVPIHELKNRDRADNVVGQSSFVAGVPTREELRVARQQQESARRRAY